MKDTEKRINTAVAEPQNKINAMTITYYAARLRHLNIDVCSALEGQYISPGDIKWWSLEYLPLSDADMGLQRACLEK